MANTAEQMEMFGYTPEGAKQEAKRLASDINTDLTFKEAATNVGSIVPGISTAMTIAEIEEELKKENPSYGKIVLLGGSEIIGLIPGLGNAAKAGLRAAAKKIGANKIVDALDAPKPKPESEIIAGPGSESYYDKNLDKAIELKKQGASPAEIETKTGRVETADDFITYKTAPGFDRYNIFKFEIDDTDAQLFGQYQTGIGANKTFAKTRDASVQNPARLGQVLDHPELFKEYPKLKNIKFAFRSKKGQEGAFSSDGGGLGPTIFIDEKFKNKSLNDPKLRDVLFHEIQHAVQYADFLESGLKIMSGNPEYYAHILSRPVNTLGVAKAAKLRKNKKLMDTRKEILNLFDQYKDTGAFDVIVTYPNGVTKVVKATDKFQGGHSFTQEIENLQLDHATQQTVQAIFSKQLGKSIDPNSAIQPLKVTPVNPEMAEKVANKMFLLRRELHREYLKAGSEVESRVVGARAKVKGKSPDKKLSADIAKQKRIQTMGEFSKDKPDNFFTKKLKAFNEDTFTPGFNRKLTDDTIVDFLGKAVDLNRFDVGIDTKLDFKFSEGGLAKQMETFGYTPEGLDQEVEKYAGEAKKDFAESKLEEERRANHPLNDVPFFQRPVNASTDDIEVPTSDPDVRAFKNKFGETYTIAISPDQRNEYKKLRDGIINSIEGIKGYLEDPSLPSKEQVVDFVKGAAVGTLEQIKQSMSSGASYGDIFGTLAGVGAASTPFKVPEGSLRAGFTGTNPSTYEPRPPKINPELKNIDDLLKMRQDDIRNNRIPGLTKQQEMEIHNKHYSRPDYLNPDVTWASTAREYGIPVSRVQKAANRINMVNRLLIQRSLAGQKKVEPDDRAAVSNEIFFRMPVIEFVRNLDIPKKGILGSNFLKLVEKNPSIADSSFLRQKESINPTKRYSRKELQETLLKNSEFFTAGKVKSGGSQFDRYQRQKLIGFRGGSEREYFEIPIRSFKSASSEVRPDEKLSFRPKRGTHYGDSAIAHVRGSIIKRKIKPGATDTEKNLNEGVNSGFNEAPEFSKIIGDQPFLLAEEIQSNLVKGGFLKTNFDEIYDEAIYRFNDASEIDYGEAFAPVGDDKKFRDLVKEIDKENPFLPGEFIYEYGIQFGLEGERQSRNFGIRPPRDSKNITELINFKKYLGEKLKSKGFLKDFPPSEEIKTTERFFDFYGRYRQGISLRTKFQSTGNVKKALEEYDSPPITKTKQAVEESLKALIAKAAMENVNYIVFPNVARIKMARNKQFDPGNKSDMFYKMYFKELNEALVDLEKNYPVEIYSIDLPYDDKAFLTTPTSMLTSEVPNLYLDTFRKFFGSDSPKLTNEVIPKNGTVLDITELVKKFKVEEPRQFAEGGTVMNKQMQMAFMNEGGLTDDGMDVDPVSGNDIPAGSMAEEVRDDIPAQLSDGEYVVPADVVRYYGVKFFEDLRDQAKRGLAEMEANGRIGGEPVPEGGPMNTEELSPEEMQAIQEIMGMSQGGAIGQFKQQQEVLEQPPAKAVGNPVMMANGGDVESNMLGGKTSAQVEQDMLAQGNAAMNQNYTGIPLGSTIFNPVNTNTGVQQTEAKAFTPVVLYNTAGQTRTVNSEEEEKSARAAGFNMTLDEYNMYRSQRGGSGGTGGGSGIITPPGQEDKENKPWGEGTDWNNEDSIREFVKNAQEGNIQGASGRFLRGAGFALFGLPGVLLAGAFQTFQAKQTLADMQTAKEIARANGFPELEKEIEGNINTYLKTAGDAVNFINDVFGPGTSQSDRFAKTQGFDTFEDYEAAQEDMRAKSKTAKKLVQPLQKLTGKKDKKGNVLVSDKGVKDTQKILETTKDLKGTTENLKDVTSKLDQMKSGVTTGFKKGGLMTKNKKAKK
jgi:hypothetical protein